MRMKWMSIMNPKSSNKMSIQLLDKKLSDESIAKDLYQITNSGFQGHSPWQMVHILNTIKAKNALVLIASYAGEKVGFIAAAETPYEIDIFLVVVAAAYKKKNIGTKLFKSLFDYGQTKNIEAITLETRSSNIPALTLYEKMGFKKVGERKAYYNKPVEDAVIMKREL